MSINVSRSCQWGEEECHKLLPANKADRLCQSWQLNCLGFNAYIIFGQNPLETHMYIVYYGISYICLYYKNPYRLAK